MSNSSNMKSNGIGFGGLLTIVFITLKLTGNIDWSWWFVLMPLYILPVVLLGLAGVVFSWGFILVLIDTLSDKFKSK